MNPNEKRGTILKNNEINWFYYFNFCIMRDIIIDIRINKIVTRYIVTKIIYKMLKAW